MHLLFILNHKTRITSHTFFLIIWFDDFTFMILNNYIF